MTRHPTNKIGYLLFCALLGAIIAGVVWVFLKLMGVGIELLWHILPGNWGKQRKKYRHKGRGFCCLAL